MAFDELFAADHTSSEEVPESQPASQSEASEDTSSETPPVESADTWDVPGVGKVTRDELIKGYLRTQDYTRKTMAVSAKEREFQTLQQQNQALEAAVDQVRTFLQDKARVAAHLQSLGPAEADLQPDAILTAAEAQALLTRKLGESEAGFQKRLEALEEKIVTGSYRQQYESQINSKMVEIGSRHPELRSIPGMEVLLKEAVRSQKPTTIEDALALYEQAGEFYATKLKGLAKTAMVQPNNPLLRGIQPPNGAALAPQQGPTEFSGIKDPNLRDQVIRDLEAILQRS
jgi:hypothetical protein